MLGRHCCRSWLRAVTNGMNITGRVTLWPVKNPCGRRYKNAQSCPILHVWWKMWDMNIISAVTGCLPFSLPLTTISRRQLWTA